MAKRKRKTKPKAKNAPSVVVVAECISCKSTREIGPGEVAPDDVPMCEHCYNPMIAKGARGVLR